MLLVGRRADGCWRASSSRSRATSAAPARAATDRRDQPERQRGRAVPVDRAGGAVADRARRERGRAVFAWYNLVGSFATALGALAGGGWPQRSAGRGARRRSTATGRWWSATRVAGRRCWRCCSRGCRRRSRRAAPGSAAARRARSAAVLGPRTARAASCCGCRRCSPWTPSPGGFVIQSIVAYWFHLRFGVEPASLGGIFFGANILAGVSALLAARLAARIGLINTMVFTHLPSNVLLILVPLMPTCRWRSRVLLRASASRRWTCRRASRTRWRWSAPDERSAARASPASRARLGAAIAPLVRRRRCSRGRR